MKNGKFTESPAKATGNDVFSASPSINDWYETIKLNYGVDYGQGRKTYFNPLPPVWIKMRDILVFWAKKNVDGFRCDVAEMVPVEFWSWVIPQVKKINPKIIFIGEAYDPREYQRFLTTGKFDFLYDKVGLYDALKKLIRNEASADVKDIKHVWKEESAGFSSHMLRFLENHDEERIASAGFAGNPWYAVPAMVVAATMGSGPVMIYFGQEVGEPGKGKEGFGGEDNRTTIFDYWGVPEHQQWMNNGKYDGGKLSTDQQRLRKFYAALFRASTSNPAIRKGKFYAIYPPEFSSKHFAYIRFTGTERILVIANFDREKPIDTRLYFTPEVLKILGLSKTTTLKVNNLLTGEMKTVKSMTDGIPIKVATTDAVLLKF
jgi:glycosidase